MKKGWTLLNDIPTAWGNIDHVLVGPAGVFVLETKNLSGILSVERGVLAVRWHEDPDDGYENRRLAHRVRASAADLHEALGHRGVSTWVQPVVVLWSTFEQRSLLSSGVAWTRGRDLVDVLKARPTAVATEEITCVVHDACAALAPDRDASASLGNTPLS